MARNVEGRHSGIHTVENFTGLEGGMYGFLTLETRTRHKLEVQLGYDFVVLNRRQAEHMRDALQRFLDLVPSGERAEETVAVTETVEVTLEEEEHRPRKRGRA